jgi:putative endopeptidase
MPRLRLLVAPIAIAFVQTAAAQTSSAPSSVVRMPALKVFDASYIDTSVNACQDFFAFANGAWVKRDTIPAAFSSSGVSKDMTDRNELVVRSVLDDAMARRHSLPADNTVAKLGTFYASCMDSARAEKEGIAPIKPQLDRIAAIKTRAALVNEIGSLQKQGVNALFNFFPSADPKDAAHYIAWATQGGLGMPDRDYYTKTDPATDSLRKKFVAHVERTLVLAGESQTQSAEHAQRVMALETDLAKASMTRLERRDPNKTYHKTSIADLGKLAPAIDWPVYFRNAGVTAPVGFINVAQPEFMKRASMLITTLPLEDWRAYLKYHLLSTASRWLSTPFVREDFAYTSLYSGTKEMLPRWKRCLRVSDNQLGEALGEAYVAKTFSPEARAQAKQIIDDIRASFRDRLQKLTWMSDSTRRFALAKLAAMNEKVGYPDKWRDYSKLRVVDGPFIPNYFSSNVFEWERIANRPGKPVDKTEWDMTVPTVNAYYDPSINEMVFPAGALAPQTFDPAGDLASNYGSLGGSWAGHELTHGFDDEGRRFDAKGNLLDWWLPADSVAFTQQAKLIVDQFNGYVQVDTIHVNGELTLGENLADFGGLVTAYDALQRALNRTGKREVIDGYTPEQRFFIAYAQSWRGHTRPEQLRTRVKTDPHAPSEWRTNGPVSNMPEFAAAFHCKPGDPMVRAADKIPHIW